MELWVLARSPPLQVSGACPSRRNTSLLLSVFQIKKEKEIVPLTAPLPSCAPISLAPTGATRTQQKH